ncbi:hypothetical protein [Rathayibacter sp. AY1A4]|uniref:hypothetical protein n=1 Tax=Rathayibacter sp. AY1A4 TaxID=2080522 RepID=UPI0011B0315B|nr:hypothetical protein [Rathayibacter sp. AY1A4]
MATSNASPPRLHRAALTRYLRATGLVQVPEAAPVVEMLRALADELDAGGGQRPRAEYRQYLKLANQLYDTSPRRKKAAPEPPAQQPAVIAPEPSKKVSSLAAFKEGRGITA